MECIKDNCVLIKGGGDIASGTAYRLYKSGFQVAVCDIPKPKMVRRGVSFAEAIYHGSHEIEGVKGVYVKNEDEFEKVLEEGHIPVFINDLWSYFKRHFEAKVIIDGRMQKRKNSTEIDEAEIVIGLGPGFEAKKDVDAVIETNRGHYLGRAIYEGKAEEYTAKPGKIMGISKDRVLYSPKDGKFDSDKEIGDHIEKGEIFAYVDGEPIEAKISGVIRGQISWGRTVKEGWKIGDIDPRDDENYCYTISDKSLAVAGGALEAILHFAEKKRG
ncbi:MAG: selenium-dependent molybdenum cofactor biosynthesis protein YqeB [Bacillota bacterium]